VLNGSAVQGAGRGSWCVMGRPRTALAEGWNGTRWAVQSVPDASAGRLSGIPCPAAEDCEATGFEGGSTSGPLAFV